MGSSSESSPPPGPGAETAGGSSDRPPDSLYSDTAAIRREPGQAMINKDEYLRDLQAAIEREKDIAAEKAPLPRFLKAPRGPLPPELTRQAILHIDDDKQTLTLVSQVLADAGYKVISAESGFAGVDIFRRQPYDFSLVVTDLTMPFMNGEETFERLREIRSDIAVILATGFIQEDRLCHLKNLGLAGFLRKPIPPDELIGIVRTTLEGVKYSGGNFSSAGTSITL